MTKSLVLYFIFALLVLANIEKVVFRADSTQNLLINEFQRLCKVDSIDELSGLYTIIKSKISFQGKQKIKKRSKRKPCQNDRNSLAWYVLNNLKAASLYEARVSYSSMFPSEWEIKLFSLRDLVRLYGLDVDIVSNKELLDKDSKMFLSVETFPVGVSLIEKDERPPIRYNIVLEALVFGVPYQAIKMVIACAVVVFAGVVLFVPYITDFIMRTRDEILENEKIVFGSDANYNNKLS
ncbi:hypothetical protein BB559_005447 [Furculomyces boomerangus]|uniref:Uncharacterized protein n=2 Tax=Harpellales TaxID=61421 RepID=A0A2T9Y8R3_9FUNG|nr:hypothetical protein BB559_005447 [Furculomyces boomerangus]PWA01112.1 hypothetical protein BB558_002834 [Smittium angustum]